MHTAHATDRLARAFVVALAACGSAALFLCPRAHAGELAFRRHVLNADSQFSACAVFDVNGDGKPDIVSGGFWYEGPTWRRHFLRDVTMIGNRYDDYSNLPLDVNGDGHTDIISVNYRSKSLYWCEHPRKLAAGPSSDADAAWPTHVIDKPGPSETGRLVDVDGDGQLDVLPNGTSFAAWYEVVCEKGGDGETRPRWVRHDLPKDVIGHGLGFGDINGDGRGDLVSPYGWLEAPQDRRSGTWRWHPDFKLHHDGSIPLLVFDVDGDGDNDLVWGRGHDIGLYWMEQVRDGDARQWVMHAIDTSWSQPHSLLLADLDNDGQPEVIAGKRYLGHDGHDAGEYDPLVIYWYRFDRAAKTWQRGLIGWGVGFDLDPKAADVDGDGDIDIVAPARNGLSLFENLLVHKGDLPTDLSSTPPAAPAYSDHAKLLFHKDAAGAPHDVKDAFDWGVRRAHILAGMERAMGELPGPSRRVPLDVKVLSEEDTPHYVRKKITYAADPGIASGGGGVDRVPAFLLIPKNLKGPAPAMLCLHPTSPLGKAQIAGLGGQPTRFYAHELAERGYVCLVPDYPSFGDYKYDFKTDGKAYASGTMKAIWNNIRGLDLLESLPEVNADRIGAIGHSLGGHNALFTAAFDQRIRAVVTSCGFNAFAHYYGGNLKGWTSDRYMPRIAGEFGSDPAKMPFDFHEVLAAMAPRPVFINAPKGDANFAVAGVEDAVAAAAKVYALRKASDRLHVVYPEGGHDFPDAVRHEAYKWLDAQLKQ
jgi:dienelactone hydrolase